METPEERARIEARADAITAGLGGVRTHQFAAISIVKADGTRAEKRRKLFVIADKLGAAIQPHTPCRKGCADCCHMAVPISRTMAEFMAKASGRQLDESAGEQLSAALIDRLHDVNVKKYFGTACPFLDQAARVCTIYEERPLACRMHHSLADTAEPCQLDHPTAQIPSADMKWLEQMEAVLDFGDRWADVREFFK